MKQLTTLEQLKGKTITDAFGSDDSDDDCLILKFESGEFAVFEGGGSYAADMVCNLKRDLGTEFGSFHSDNKLLVLLGVRSQDELDLFYDKERRHRDELQRKAEEARKADAAEFPTLSKLGVIK